MQETKFAFTIYINENKLTSSFLVPSSGNLLLSVLISVGVPFLYLSALVSELYPLL